MRRRGGRMTVALYRRYRPQTFADVIGQEHVTDPLRQALRTGRVGHAYLFSGPRGCGKTTSARILARCLNCERGPTDEPCGQCPSCVALARGGPGSVDVIEIDAASHGGVEDARDLREKASYGPAQSRYKVYIIDEAHMVTPQGFNALLKIVEEPPEHVKFVFATTEPEKVIGTIRSRTHHYPFRLVPPSRLTQYLEQLCVAEDVAVASGVLSFVVRAGGGSVRDSLSVLDQLMAGSGPEGLTYDGAASLLGFTPDELLDATVEALAAGDGASVFRQIDRVVETGQDPRRFVEDLLERFRDLIVISAMGVDTPGGPSAVLRGLPQDQLARMRQQATSFGPGQLSHAADTINAGLTEMTGATSPRLHLELICARLLLPGTAGERGYAARLDRLERRLEVAGPPPPTSSETIPRPAAPVAAPSMEEAATTPVSTDMPAEPARSARPTRELAPTSSPPADAVVASQPPARSGDGPQPTAGIDTDALRRSWPDVLAKIFTIRRVTWTFLSEHAQVLEYDGQRLVLGIATVGLATTFRNGLHAEVVRQALIDSLGLDVLVEGVPHTPGGSPTPSATPRGADRSGGSQPAQSGPSARSGQLQLSPATDANRAQARRAAMDGRGGAVSDPAAAPRTVAPRTAAAGTAARGDAGREASHDDRGTGARRPAVTSPPPRSTAEQPLPEPPEDPYDTPPPPEETAIAADAGVSADDEDIDGREQVGTPVIANVLGGTIIDDRAE